MEITLFGLVTVLLHKLGITFGVGASTFALTFYIKALEDHTIDASERSFLHAVYVVLRVGMVLIGLSLVLFTFQYLYSGVASTLPYSQFVAEWILLTVIILNAILMTYKYMPMRFGPIIAGGSWYSLFLLNATPLYTLSYSTLLGLYLIFFILFFIIFSSVKKHFVGEQ